MELDFSLPETRPESFRAFAPILDPEFEFSDGITSTYLTDLNNILTPFVKKGHGYEGARDVPIKFHHNKRPCEHHSTSFTFTTSTAQKYLETLPKAIATSTVNRRHRITRERETAAIHALTNHLPRSTRAVNLLHWLGDGAHVWKHAKNRDVFYCKQWLDTHAHPAWTWPGAQVVNNFMILLRIHAPENTKMHRIRRHSRSDAEVQALRPGEWGSADEEHSGAEVRLPPGSFRVHQKPSVEHYAGLRVLLVNVTYTSEVFSPCDSMWKRAFRSR